MKVMIYLGLAILCSCITQNYTDELKNNFDQKEIADLEKMVHFFQGQMCNKKNDFELCMDSLAPILGEQGWNPILDNVDFEQQKELYDDFQSNLFNEIWSFCKTSNPREGWIEESLDTLKVMDSCFVLLTPNITLIEKLKTEYCEEDFYTIADDNQYYLSECRSYLEERGVKIIETSKRVVDFKIKDSNGNYIVNSDSIGGWGIIMFNGVSRPYIADIADFEYSMAEFRKQ